MMHTDIINAIFELLAALFILNHCRVLYRDKQVKGVSVISALFFTLWGFWNLYFYPAVGQPFSFWAGAAVVTANAIYVGMLCHYDYRQCHALDEHAVFIGEDMGGTAS